VQAGYALQPMTLTEVKATRAGIVEKVVVSDGDAASAGTVLVKLDVADVNKKIQDATDQVTIAEKKRQTAIAKNRNAAKAQADLQKALAMQKAAQAAFDKVSAENSNAKPVAISATKKVLDQATAAAEKAQKAYDKVAPKTPEADAEVKKANDELAAAKAELSKSEIVSPKAGVVIGLSVKAGAKVSEGDTVAKVGDPTPLKVLLAPKKPGTFKPGQTVELKVGEQMVKTTLTSAGKDTAEAQLDNKDGKIKPSGEGEATINAEPRPLIHFGAP
jgi:multidrug efflux pump subunit AcrA (membrane-fusion protein)